MNYILYGEKEIEWTIGFFSIFKLTNLTNNSFMPPPQTWKSPDSREEFKCLYKNMSAIGYASVSLQK